MYLIRFKRKMCLALLFLMPPLSCWHSYSFRLLVFPVEARSCVHFVLQILRWCNLGWVEWSRGDEESPALCGHVCTVRPMAVQYVGQDSRGAWLAKRPTFGAAASPPPVKGLRSVPPPTLDSAELVIYCYQLRDQNALLCTPRKSLNMIFGKCFAI